ncbi:MAG TPA: 6-phosphogluconolactonase [Terriglobales bacterium]
MTEPGGHHEELKVVPDAAALNRDAAEEFCRCADSAIAARGRFAAALSGGNTPRGVYAELAAQKKNSLPWDKIYIFFGDERYVPSGDPASNYRMARESLLSKVTIPEENVHRVLTELPATTAAVQYEMDLRNFFRLPSGGWPRFDLILLGLGEDGHTASLFPGSEGIHEQSRLVISNWVEKLADHRITFTYPVLNHADQVVFLVSGKAKAPILKDIFSSAKQNSYPAQAVRPENGKLLWLVDQDAAGLLS